MGMALDEPKENEQAVQVNGIGVLLEDMVKPFTEGTIIDYVKEPSGEGFVIGGAGSSC